THDEGTGAMAKILKFATFDFSRGQGQTRMLAFKCLHSGEFIGTHGAFSLFGHLRGLLIDLTGRHDSCFALRVGWRSEPIADQMRLETPFFKRREAWREEMCCTMPSCISSSAISRPVQWLMGRSFGWSHAIAIIWYRCWAVIWEGLPGRGTSVSRSATESSLSGTPCKLIQRMRQLRTVSTLTPSSLAISAFLFPSAAPRIMRPRLASCWGVECRCTSASSLLCSSSLTVSSAGFGPFCISSALLFFLLFYHTMISASMY